MKSRPVAVLDSGIGGLPYLSWLQEHLPQESVIYMADHANFPYGEKTPDQVREFVVELGRALVDRYDPKLLLVACNTASVLALDALRSALSIPVVGVVPAVKTAVGLGTGTVAVLATPRTVEDGYWENLARKFGSHRLVKGYAAPDLVTMVEEGASDAERRAKLTAWARRLRSEGVDVVVLGCTHYLHIAEDLGRELGSSVTVVDSRNGVGRQVARVLRDRSLLSTGRKESDRLVFTVAPHRDCDNLAQLEARYRVWAERFDLEYAGPWAPGAKTK
jgi:glutamate racemase